MADLNEEQLIKKKNLLESGLGIPEETIDQLVTAEDTQLAIDDYIKGKYDKRLDLAEKTQSTTTKISNEEAMLEYGVDQELVLSSKAEAKQWLIDQKKIEEESLVKWSENSLFTLQKHSGDIPYKLKLNMSGIKTDQGAPAVVRELLGYSFQQKNFLEANGKLLLVRNLIENGMFTQAEYDANPSAVQVLEKPLSLGKRNKQGIVTDNVLVWRIMPELHGDGYFRPFNEPGNYLADFRSAKRQTIETGAAVTGFIVGSLGAGGPVVGGPLWAAVGRYFSGVMLDLHGIEELGLEGPSEEQIMKAHISPMALEFFGGVFFSKLFVVAKAASMGSDKMVSGKMITDFVRNYKGGDPKVIAAIADAKAILKKQFNISDNEAANYLATSVKKMYPNIEVGYHQGAGSTTVEKGLDILKKKSKIQTNVEDKIMQKLAGTEDQVSINAIRDYELTDSIKASLIAVNKAELKAAEAMGIQIIKDAEQSVLGHTSFKPNADLIYKTGMNMSKITEKVYKQLQLADDMVKSIANKNNLKVMLGDVFKKNSKALNRIIGKDVAKQLKTLLPDRPIKPKNYKTDKLAARAYDKSLIEFNELAKSFDALGIKSISDIQSMLKGINRLFTKTNAAISYEQATALKNIIKFRETQALSEVEQQYLRKVKGILNTSLLDAARATKNKELFHAMKQQLELQDYVANSFIGDFARSFGYGTNWLSRTATRMEKASVSEDIFLKYFSNSQSSRINAQYLGQLLENNQLIKTNWTLRNEIKGTAYEFYRKKVLVDKMPFKDFIKEYGENMKYILGKTDKGIYAEYNAFKTNASRASTVYEKWMKEYGDGIGTLTKYLKIDGELGTYTSEHIAQQIMKIGNIRDINIIKKVLDSQGAEGWQGIKQHIVKDMFNKSSLESSVTGSQTYSGPMLAKYLKENQAILREVFGHEFYEGHKQLALALSIVQNFDDKALKELGKLMGLSDVVTRANSAGLWVDIIYGPLNHKRLIMNRLARIYASFDIDGSTFNKLYDYKIFLSHSMNSFAGGYYPKTLLRASNLEKMKWWDKIIKYSGPNKEAFFLLIPGHTYFTEKTVDLSQIKYTAAGETDITAPVDEALDYIGEKASTYILQPVSNAVSWLTNALITGGNISKDEPALIRTREELEKINKIDAPIKKKKESASSFFGASGA